MNQGQTNTANQNIDEIDKEKTKTNTTETDETKTNNSTQSNDKTKQNKPNENIYTTKINNQNYSTNDCGPFFVILQVIDPQKIDKTNHKFENSKFPSLHPIKLGKILGNIFPTASYTVKETSKNKF